MILIISDTGSYRILILEVILICSTRWSHDLNTVKLQILLFGNILDARSLLCFNIK